MSSMFASISLVLRVSWDSAEMSPGGWSQHSVFSDVAEEPTPQETSTLLKGGGRGGDSANLSSLYPSVRCSLHFSDQERNLPSALQREATSNFQVCLSQMPPWKDSPEQNCQCLSLKERQNYKRPTESCILMVLPDGNEGFMLLPTPGDLRMRITRQEDISRATQVPHTKEGCVSCGLLWTTKKQTFLRMKIKEGFISHLPPGNHLVGRPFISMLQTQLDGYYCAYFYPPERLECWRRWFCVAV